MPPARLSKRPAGAAVRQQSAPPDPAQRTYDADDDGRRKLTRRFIQVVVKHMQEGAEPPLSLTPADLGVDDANLQVLVRAGLLLRDETWEPQLREMIPVPDEIRKLCLETDETQALRALEPRVEEAWPDPTPGEQPRPTRRRSLRVRGQAPERAVLAVGVGAHRPGPPSLSAAKADGQPEVKRQRSDPAGLGGGSAEAMELAPSAAAVADSPPAADAASATAAAAPATAAAAPASDARPATLSFWPAWLAASYSDLVYVLDGREGVIVAGDDLAADVANCLRDVCHACDWGSHGSRDTFLAAFFDLLSAQVSPPAEGELAVVDPPSGDSALILALTEPVFEGQARLVQGLLRLGASVERSYDRGRPRDVAERLMPSLLEALRANTGDPRYDDDWPLCSAQAASLDDWPPELFEIESTADFDPEVCAQQVRLCSQVLSELPPAAAAATIIDLPEFFCMDADTIEEGTLPPIVLALAERPEPFPMQAWVLKRIVSSCGNQGLYASAHTMLDGRTPEAAADARLGGLLAALCE